jgi:hypothetical protein
MLAALEFRAFVFPSTIGKRRLKYIMAPRSNPVQTFKSPIDNSDDAIYVVQKNQSNPKAFVRDS